MSTFFLADRIKEFSRTETAGPIVLDGAAPGFSSFDDFFASGDVVFYAITDNVDYEVGSGVYEPNGGDRVITRHPFRSSNINSGPYYVNGDETDGPAGYYYPLYLTRSAAQSGVGFVDGPYTNVSELTFVEFPGITFYRPSEHPGYSATVGISGSNYNSLSSPVDFDPGVKEVFVTYPGKSAVFNGYGLDSDINEPKDSGIAFWRNESILNYSSQLVWDDTNNFLGIAQASPEYALDIGGVPSFSIVRASGFIEGGSGIAFSGGAITYTGDTASGGVQYEPFLRNELGSGSQGLIEFSGIVNQYIGIAKQTPGTVYAGPEVDHCGTPPCDPDYPSFRLLTLDDLPLAELTTSGGFVIQENLGLDSQTANISPNNYALGMVAIYAGSGGITYDSGILFDYNNNRLLVGGDASVDTPSYTLDARGTIGSQSGYFNQLLFTDDLIRIGTKAGTNDGNLQGNYYMIGIGNDAGFNTSGIFDGLFLGRFAGLDAEVGSGTVMIGVSAGRATNDIKESLGVGSSALQSADTILSGVVIGQSAGQLMVSGTNFVAAGPKVFFNSTEISESVAIGHRTAENGSGVDNSVLIGELVGFNVDQFNSSVALGIGSASGSFNLLNVVAIGNNAASSAKYMTNVVAVGTNAAKMASGINNTYLGGEAGHGASGNNNIELTNNGTALAGTNSSKINLGGVIQGDLTSNKLSLGTPSGLDPIATVVVEPASANDAAFLIKLQGSGSIANPVEVQSGDGTVQYYISNSGDVKSAGWTQPSGGLWLPNANPTRNSGEGGFMLWNDGNTLIWNGSPVSGENGYTQWQFLTESGGGTITNNQQIVVSGISGIQVVSSGVGNRRWTVDGGELSGILVELSGQIAASNYNFYTAASGDQLNNNSGKLMESDSWLVLSGVNGIEIDFLDQTDGTNSSGIFEISYNPSAAYTFNATNGSVTPGVVADDETVVVSGISGVEVQFDDQANGSGLFTISASGLSGTLQTQIDANLGFLSNENGPISLSGVSGIAAYASGQVDNISQGGATSGLKQQNNSYIMDPTGIGNLKILNFPDGRVILRADPDESPDTNWLGGPGSILIGSGAGVGAATNFEDTNVTVIGAGAMGGNGGGARSGMVVLGYEAFSNEPQSDTVYSIAIGRYSLSRSSGNYNIGIGYNAGRQQLWSLNGRGSEYNLALGFEAGFMQDGETTGFNVSIGAFAGRYASSGGANVGIGNNAMAGTLGAYAHNNLYSVGVGQNAGYTAKNINNGVFLGRNAGFLASGHNEPICIGYNAGYGTSGSVLGDHQDSMIAIGEKALYQAQDVEQTIAIGDFAGSEASGVEHSVFIGRYAGWKRSGTNSLIISNRSTVPPEGYDAAWAPHTESEVLDIGHAIQGVMDPCNIHIGDELNNTYRTLSDINIATVSVTPETATDSAMVLWMQSTDGTNSSQAAGLMKTQTKYLSTPGSMQSTLNEIINSQGFLRLPRATGVTGSYPNKVLQADGQGVSPGPGVMAVYEFSPSDRGLAICLNDGGTYTWYKLPITTVL